MEIRASEAQGTGLSRTEGRIAWLTVALGLVTALIVGSLGTWRPGLGVLIGALLAWVNFRWLQGALDALVRVSTSAPDKAAPRVPFWAYARFFARYLLIGVVLYGMVTGFGIPILSLLGGLCALGAATMVGSLYEVIAQPE